MKLKKIFSMFLVLTLLAGLSIPTFAQETTITRGEAAEMIYQVAKGYNSELKEAAALTLSDTEGNARLDSPITNAETVVMLERAFGTIPEAKGNNKRIADPTASYLGIPEWAEGAYQSLLNGGILSGERLATATMDKQELSNMLGRLIRLYGSNLKDNFYQHFNKEWMDTTVMQPGYGAWSAMSEMDYRTTQQIEAILDELAEGTYEAGTPEYYISTYYKNALAREDRNAAGITPIQKYLDAIDSINTMEDVQRVQREIYEGTGINYLYGLGFDVDNDDSSKKTILFSTAGTKESKNDLENGTERVTIYADSTEALFKLAGDPNPRAAIEKMIALEKRIAAASLPPQELYNPNLAFSKSTFAEVDAMFKTVDLAAFAKNLGIKVSGDTEISVYQPKLVAAFAEELTDENIDVLKTFLKADLLWSSSGLLSEDFIAVADEYSRRALGLEDTISYKRRAISATMGNMGEYLGQVYVQRHFSEETKRDVEQMVKEFVEVYRQTLSENTWLTEETRAGALKKLDTLVYKIGYPDEWVDFLKGYDMGETFYDSTCTVAKASVDYKISQQDNPPDRGEWDMNVYQINAYYNPPFNEIVFPAAILQAPFYDPDAKREANLGGIGVVIAHEISHAFDDSGSQYDEKGNAVNWWTDADFAEFEKRCEAVVNFYDGIEIAPRIISNGKLTLGENIADLEGVNCALAVAKRMPNADLKAFFEQYAATWQQTASREMLQYLSVADVHSTPEIRVNRTLQAISDFFTAYGITEGDTMFVPAEERVKVW